MYGKKEDEVEKKKLRERLEREKEWSSRKWHNSEEEQEKSWRQVNGVYDGRTLTQKVIFMVLVSTVPNIVQGKRRVNLESEFALN